MAIDCHMFSILEIFSTHPYFEWRPSVHTFFLNIHCPYHGNKIEISDLKCLLLQPPRCLRMLNSIDAKTEKSCKYLSYTSFLAVAGHFSLTRSSSQIKIPTGRVRILDSLHLTTFTHEQEPKWLQRRTENIKKTCSFHDPTNDSLGSTVTCVRY